MSKDKGKKVDKNQQLLEASRLGQLQQLENLLSQFYQLKSKKKTNPLASLRKSVSGPNNIRDPVTGFTCLHHASLNGHAACVKLILNYGAKLNALDYKGSSALHLASWAGNLEIVKILLNYNNSDSQQQQQQQLFSSSPLSSSSASSTPNSPTSSSNNNNNNNKNCSPTQKSSLQSQNSNNNDKINIDLCNNDNQTPLSLAAQFGHNEVVAELLSFGANVNIRNSQLESPLDLACLNGRLETVNLILKSSPFLINELQKSKSTILINQNQQQFMMATTATAATMRINKNYNYNSNSLNNENNENRSDNKKGGWSTLLLNRNSSSGNRKDSNTTTTTTTGSCNQTSPLQRFSPASLSMRQATKFFDFSSYNNNNNNNNNTELSNKSTSSKGDKRRATLSISAPLPPNFNNINYAQQQQQHYLSKQISADNGGYYMPAIAQLNQNQNHQNHQNHQNNDEKLLDHSPLHYAVRKGHLNVIKLLLYTYNANVMQLTTLGSVLHEIALSNGRQQLLSDIISLIFNFICLNNNENKIDLLNRFLNLKNSNEKSVFEVLNEINNRFANEIKRLIYEHGERQLLANNNNNVNINNVGQIFNRKLCNSFSNSNISNASNQDLSSQQQQQLDLSNLNLKNQQQTSNMQFSDIKQINSFVTMKRVPKQQQQQQQQQQQLKRAHQIEFDQNRKNSCSSQFMSNQQQQQLLLLSSSSKAAFETQTIGRKSSNSKLMAMMMNQQQQQQQQQSYQPLINNNQTISNNYFYHPYEQSVFPTTANATTTTAAAAAAPIMMTRSVSNLNQSNSREQQNYFKQPDDNSSMLQHQWLINNTNQMQLINNNNNNKQRSKSRDLGSLLQEANRLNNNNCNEFKTGGINDDLYDNADTSSPFDNVINNNSLMQQQQQQQYNHLVRSQTDCSHLMGRFFGDYNYNHDFNNQNQFVNLNGQRQMHHQQPFGADKSISRKTINRHYHVYDHEFYPPRLISSINNQNNNLCSNNYNNSINLNSTVPNSSSEQLLLSSSSSSSNRQNYNKQMIAVVPPLNKQQESYKYSNSNDHNNATMNCKKQIDEYPSSTASGCCQNSRHSLNIDNNNSLQQQQQQQMDRFLYKNNNNYDRISTIRCNSVDQRGTSDEKEFINNNQINSNNNNNNLPNSFSLESHLSEPYLFESTRLALMKDFDNLIGRELLNRNHQQIIDGNLIKSNANCDDSNNSKSKSQQSILTGVMLDMDSKGDRLIVSGTRITMPPQHQQQPPPPPPTTTTTTTTTTKRVQQQTIEGEKNNLSSIKVASNGTQTNENDLLSLSTNENKTIIPPIKPPRPSLNTKHHRDQMAATRQQQSTPSESVIYDLPTTTTTTNNISKSSNNKRIISGDRIQKLTAQFSAAAAATNNNQNKLLSKSSLTEPPKVKPPPPPSQLKQQQQQQPVAVTTNINNSLTSPLQIVAPTTNINNSHQPASLTSTNSSSSPSTSISNNEFGSLLKMSSINSTTSSNSNSSSKFNKNNDKNKKTSLINNNNNDMDSGVCTSNSPASISHDSELSCSIIENQSSNIKQEENDSNGREKLLLNIEIDKKNINEGKEGDNYKYSSPPSPNTAQLCIEEALMPLANKKKLVEVNHQMTSPMIPIQDDHHLSTINSLLINCHNEEEEEEVKREKSDYENCLALQKQLALSDAAKLISTNSKDTDDDDDDADADYATQSPSTIEGENDEAEDDCDYDNVVNNNNNDDDYKLKNENDYFKNQERKEVLLKVVIDEKERNLTGNEVFYINPSELKKLTTRATTTTTRETSEQASETDIKENNGIQMMDAESLTDEELCAAIDKETGFIKFMLRKRKIPNDSEKLLDCSQSNYDQEKANFKKTKLFINSNELNNFENNEKIKAIRRYSEFAAIDNNDNKNNNQIYQSEFLSSQNISYLDYSNLSLNSNSQQQQQQQHLKELRNWFTKNLAAFVDDYLPKFVENGLDNLKFLNNNELINDEILKSIGILDENHRLLIIESIRNKLELFDLYLKKNLSFTSNIKSDENDDDDDDDDDDTNLTIKKLFNLLEMENLLIDDKNDENNLLNKNDKKFLNLFKQKYSYLPIGYKIRLYLAIDFIIENSYQFKEAKVDNESESEKQEQIVFVESTTNSCENSLLDVSQTSSSSSSKESIKSILQIKNNKKTLNYNNSNEINSNDNAKKLIINDEKHEILKEPVNEIKIVNSKKITTSTINGNRVVVPGKGGFVLKTTNSLVSETTRKLEMAAAAANNKNNNNNPPTLPPRPIAALRKFNTISKSTSLEKDFKRDVNINNKPPALPAPPSIITINKFNNSIRTSNQLKSNESTKHLVTTTTSNSDITTNKENIANQSSLAAAATTTTTAASTKEDVNYGGQKNSVCQNQNQKKPPPPAKPAKLVAGNFNVTLSHKL